MNKAASVSYKFLLSALIVYAHSLSCAESLFEKIPFLMQKYRVPGAAIAVVKEGEVVAIKYFGFRDKKQYIKLDSTSLFQVGSISKTFAAWGVLKLVEQGKIDLDHPIDYYLKRWHLSSSQYDVNHATIRRVLNHTAGFSVPGYYGYSTPDTVPDITTSLNGVSGSHRRLEVQTPPGHKFRYSGGGYTLLQLLIEDIGGMSFRDFMGSYVFLPLHLSQTTYTPSDTNLNMCTCYGIFGGELVPRYYIEAAAAGLWATVADMAKFVKHTLMLPCATPCPTLESKTVKKMMDVNKTSYALGYDVEILPNGISLVYHEGANPGWRSGMYMIPALASGLVVLTNSERGMWLIEDIAYTWLVNETNSTSQKYINLQKHRFRIDLCTKILWGVLGIYGLFFFKNRKYRRWHASLFSYIQGVLWLLFGVGWYVAFYTPFIFQNLFGEGGWIISSFMPAGFDRLTSVILLWSIIGIGNSFRTAIMSEASFTHKK